MTARTHASRRGFTVIEILITIAIIVLLVGLTVAASTAIARRSEMNRTADALRLLDMAVQEWENAAERQLTLGVSGAAAFDLEWDDGATPRDGARLHMTQVLERIGSTAGARDILAQVDPQVLVTYNDGTVDRPQFIDAWDNPVAAVHPGWLWVSGDPGSPDQDKTLRTTYEDVFGLAENRRIYFVSAGPDGLFGLDDEFPALSGQALEDAKEAARGDNVYSYPVEAP